MSNPVTQWLRIITAPTLDAGYISFRCADASEKVYRFLAKCSPAQFQRISDHWETDEAFDWTAIFDRNGRGTDAAVIRELWTMRKRA